MRSTTTLPEARFREVVHQLTGNVAGTRAVVVIGPDGVMLDHITVDRSFDVDGCIAEVATLLRIAQRTSEDTGSGNMIEHISISENSVTLARCFASDHYIVLVSSLQDQIGRARYELRRAAWYLERRMR